MRATSGNAPCGSRESTPSRAFSKRSMRFLICEGSHSSTFIAGNQRPSSATSPNSSRSVDSKSGMWAAP